MNQSTLVTGALVFAFILFLAAKNRLGVYANVLLGKAGAPAAAAGGAPGAAGAVSPSSPAPAASPLTTGSQEGESAVTPSTVSSALATPASTALNAAATPAGKSALQTAFQSIGFGAAQQDVSDALLDAASMSGPAGMLGF